MRYGVAILLCLTFLAGCDLSNADDVALVTGVKDEMQLDLANPLTLQSQFALRLSTIEDECATSTILADGGVSAQTVHINVSGLLREPDCIVDQNIITKDVGLALDPGTYDLSIAIGDGLMNYGKLNYNGQIYTLELESDNGIQLGVQSLHRIPNKIFWGKMTGSYDQRPLFEEFAHRIGNLGSPAILTPGHYGHFVVDDNNVASLTEHQDLLSQFEIDYLYTLSGNATELNQLIKDFRTEFASEMDLSCTLWNGLNF